MGNPRQPVARSQITGAASKNPQRHRNRKEPAQGRPLGDPSDFLDENGRRAWEGFKRELPWLMESDRAIVEIAAKLRGLVLAGADVGEGKLKLLQTILSKLGASPSDRTKIAYGDDDQETDDLLD
jgi:hypothetical protein